MRKGIICGGTLVVDRIKIVDSYPKEGSLSNICSEHQNGGGAVFNVLSNLSVMDKKLPLYAAGLLGRDNNGKYLKNELINKNIDCSSISFTSRESTAITDVFISQKNGSRTFFHRKGSNYLIDIEHFEQVNPNAKIFHLGYLMILDRLDSHDDTYGTRAARLLSLLKKRGFIITVDLVTVENKSYDGILSHSLKYIDYLIINEIEAERS